MIKRKLQADLCHNNEVIAKLLSSWSCWTFESQLIGGICWRQLAQRQNYTRLSFQTSGRLQPAFASVQEPQWVVSEHTHLLLQPPPSSYCFEIWSLRGVITVRQRFHLFSCLPPQRVFMCFGTGTSAGAFVTLMENTLAFWCCKTVCDDLGSLFGSCTCLLWCTRIQVEDGYTVQCKRRWARCQKGGTRGRNSAASPGGCDTDVWVWMHWPRGRRWPELECAAYGPGDFVWGWWGVVSTFVLCCSLRGRPVLRLTQPVVLI